MRIGLPLLFAFLASFPHQPAYGPYKNQDKWYLTEGLIRQFLRGQPKQITEYILSAPDTANAALKRAYYIRFGFNSDGDLIFRHFYMHDSLTQRAEYTYSTDGYQIKTDLGK